MFFWKRKAEIEAPVRAEPTFPKDEKKRASFTASDARAVGRSNPAESVNPFKPYEPPEGVVGDGQSIIAMDEVYNVEGPSNQFWMNNAVADGVAFMGYPYLSAMAQRAEYNHIIATLADEATREWIEIIGTGDEDKNDRIQELEAEFDRLNVKGVFRKMCEQDSQYGIGHLFIDTGLGFESNDLQTPLLVDPETIKKGSVKQLVPVEAVWTAPNEYNTTNPLRSDFYVPQKWWVMGSTVHCTRFLSFVSREAGQLLKPNYNFGGIPLIQMAKPYVDNWLRTRQSVADLINGCSIVSLKSDLEGTYMRDGIGGLIERIEAFQAFRSNRGVFLTDKETEELEILSANLAGLGELQNQALEQICVVAQMPLVKFTGVTPSGLNASSDGEIRVWYDRVAAYQESFFGPHLRTIMHICMLNIWGEIDEEIDFKFVHLWQSDEQTKATVEYTKAQTKALYIEMGAVSNDEVREGLGIEDDSPFAGVDLSGEAPEDLGEEGEYEDGSAPIQRLNDLEKVEKPRVT